MRNQLIKEGDGLCGAYQKFTGRLSQDCFFGSTGSRLIKKWKIRSNRPTIKTRMLKLVMKATETQVKSAFV